MAGIGPICAEFYQMRPSSATLRPIPQPEYGRARAWAARAARARRSSSPRRRCGEIAPSCSPRSGKTAPRPIPRGRSRATRAGTLSILRNAPSGGSWTPSSGQSGGRWGSRAVESSGSPTDGRSNGRTDGRSTRRKRNYRAKCQDNWSAGLHWMGQYS